MATSPRSTALTHAAVAELLQDPQPLQAAGPHELAPPVDRVWSYLDVRTPEEFATGHVPGAYNIPYQLGDLAGLHPNPDFLGVAAATFAQHAPLIIGCRSGGRAAAAERALRGAGYTELHVHLGSLTGGRDAFGRVKDGWMEAGHAVTSTAIAGRTPAELSAARLGTKLTRSKS